MSDKPEPRSIAEKFWTICLYLFGGVLLLVFTIELLKQIWWILLILALIGLAVAAIIWWRRNIW